MDLAIELITRFRSPELFGRMLTSAEKQAEGLITHSAEDGGDEPRVAETYNRLGLKSEAGILAFVEDDIEFMEPGWDRHLREIFLEFKPDILGVIGSKKYEGGHVFDAGIDYGVGMIAGNNGVRILNRKVRCVPVKVIDGCAMFVARDFFRANRFDEAFDGLFYYDVDLCLRSKKVGVTSLLLKHSKPPEMVGVYPPDMKPREQYDPILEAKYQFRYQPIGDQRCCQVSFEEYQELGQSEAFRRFSDRYLRKVSPCPIPN